MTYLLVGLDVTENPTYNPSTTITPPQAYSTEKLNLLPDKMDPRAGEGSGPYSG